MAMWLSAGARGAGGGAGRPPLQAIHPWAPCGPAVPHAPLTQGRRCTLRHPAHASAGRQTQRCMHGHYASIDLAAIMFGPQQPHCWQTALALFLLSPFLFRPRPAFCISHPTIVIKKCVFAGALHVFWRLALRQAKSLALAHRYTVSAVAVPFLQTYSLPPSRTPPQDSHPTSISQRNFPPAKDKNGRQDVY